MRLFVLMVMVMMMATVAMAAIAASWDERYKEFAATLNPGWTIEEKVEGSERCHCKVSETTTTTPMSTTTTTTTTTTPTTTTTTTTPTTTSTTTTTTPTTTTTTTPTTTTTTPTTTTTSSTTTTPTTTTSTSTSTTTTTTPPAEVDCDLSVVMETNDVYSWKSPNYPDHYPEGITCTLEVTLPAGAPMFATVNLYTEGVNGIFGTTCVDYLLDVTEGSKTCASLDDFSKSIVNMTPSSSPQTFTYIFKTSASDGGTDVGFNIKIERLI